MHLWPTLKYIDSKLATEIHVTSISERNQTSATVLANIFTNFRYKLSIWTKHLIFRWLMNIIPWEGDRLPSRQTVIRWECNRTNVCFWELGKKAASLISDGLSAIMIIMIHTGRGRFAWNRVKGKQLCTWCRSREMGVVCLWYVLT